MPSNSPAARIAVGTAMAEAYFDQGADEEAFVLYDDAVGHLALITNPLEFLIAFVQIEFLRTTYL